jgi:hypothetical protein
MLSLPARLLAVLILIGGVGCSFVASDSAAGDSRAAAFLPADTWLFGEVTLRPSMKQVVNATRLANAFTSQPGWSDYVERMSATSGMRGTDIATEALALLDGEVAVGAFGRPDVSGLPQSAVLLAHSSNPDRLVSMLAAAEGLRLTPRKDAHGANVYAGPGAIELATLQGWLVVASTQAVLEQTLDRISGTNTTGALNNSPRFKNLVSRLPSDRLGLEYVDAGAFFRGVGDQLPTAPGVTPETLALLGDVDSQLAVSFAASAVGLDIHLEGATQLPPDAASGPRAIAAQAGDPGDAFAHVPQDTLAAFGTELPMLGAELDAALQLVLLQAAEEMDAPELAELDVHPSQWLAGPIAVGGSAGNIGEPDGVPELFAVAQVSDAAAARADLTTLTALFPPKTATPLSIAGATFVQVPAAEDLSLTYGVADDWLYATNGDAEALVGAAETGGLTQNPRFAALQSGLGEDRTNVFVDIQGLRELATSLLDGSDLQTYESEVRLLISPLTFFGGGIRSEPNGDVHGHFVLGLGD